MEKLREEILQCEAARADLLKWKLVIAGGVGAAGLGFAGSRKVQNAELVLCVIPLVAVYVDLLCRHLTLKMLVIGTFLATASSTSDADRPFAAYEAWAGRARRLSDEDDPSAAGPATHLDRLLSCAEVHLVGRRRGPKSAFDLEDWALSLSTLVLSLLLILYGPFSSFWIVFVSSGVVAVLASAIGNRQYAQRFEAVERMGASR